MNRLHGKAIGQNNDIDAASTFDRLMLILLLVAALVFVITATSYSDMVR